MLETHTLRKFSRKALGGAATLLALTLLISTAHAATFTVTNTSDDSGTGSCTADAVTDPCSLRQAIQSANNSAGSDSIAFDATAFATPQTITLSDSIQITEDISVTGPAAKVTLKAGTPAGPFPVNGLFFQVAGGSVSNLVFDGFEIGIDANSGGLVTVLQCEIKNCNFAGVRGFGSPLQLTFCRFYNNGRGVYTNVETTADCVLFDANPTAIDPFGGTVLARNCTFYNNTTAYGSSGFDTTPAATFMNCTFTKNGTALGDGGGSKTVTYSIVSGNTNEYAGTAPDYTTSITSDPTTAGLDADINGDGVLADHGGPWPTVAILPGSPAIDAAGDTGLPIDERGVTRPQGAADDIGAFELDNSDTDLPTLTVTAPTANQRILSADWVQNFVNGTAADNVGVASVDVKLVRINGSVRDYWDGSNFVSSSTSTPATLDTPGGASVTWEWAGPTSAQLGTGKFSVVVSASDAAGNVSTAITRNITVVAENEPPVITVQYPASLAKLSAADFAAGNVNGTATDNDAILDIQVKLYRTIGGTKEYWDGTQFTTTPSYAYITTSGTGTGSATWSFQTMPSQGDLVSGAYGVYVGATDRSGNIAYLTRPFSITADTQAPVVTISTPTANQRIRVSAFGSSTVTGQATDNVEATSVPVKLYRTVGGIKYFWNGNSFTTASVSLTAQLSGSGTSRPWVLTNVPGSSDLTPGNYSIQAGATDAAGNRATFVTRNFVIDADSPAALRAPSGEEF